MIDFHLAYRNLPFISKTTYRVLLMYTNKITRERKLRKEEKKIMKSE